MIHVDDSCVDAVSSDHDDLMVDSLQVPPMNISDFSTSCRGIGRDDESTDDDDDDDSHDNIIMMMIDLFRIIISGDRLEIAAIQSSSSFEFSSSHSSSTPSS